MVTIMTIVRWVENQTIAGIPLVIQQFAMKHDRVFQSPTSSDVDYPSNFGKLYDVISPMP